MPPTTVLPIVLILGAAAFVAGRRRALASAGGDRSRLHSLPGYHGWNAAIWATVPALLLLAVWSVAQPLLVDRAAVRMIAADHHGDPGALGLVLTDVHRISEGLDMAMAQGRLAPGRAGELTPAQVQRVLGEAGVALAAAPHAAVLAAAEFHRRLSKRAGLCGTAAVLIMAAAGAVLGFRQADAAFRARNAVERAVLALLAGAALIAILTTLGIVLSLIFNTLQFFRLHPAGDFFLGLTWSPSFGGESEFGILPLLWGTLYISLIALAVAVPVGILAAVHLSEYASRGVRSVVKPLLEVLAGIPTIVYGLFALVTVGPALVAMFGPDTLGWMQGGTAAMTAGLVMGIMLIPFVSSLSDDIIGAVPQALRDGSLALGATRSETIRRVVLPAALPGIVGAILLAASRAIGETMIVVMGAGAAARLSLNPFEAMTTVTAKIVSQLTGDADFASPEALVAFALGMTLFVLTLGLNVFALWIVRRYREHYE